MFAYWEYYVMGIILLPGIIFAIYAQSKVNIEYNKYARVYAKTGITACDLLRQLLDGCGLSHIKVRRISGNLTDHYDPKKEEFCLSNDIYDSNSISALGIACHEFGHALQKQKNYTPYKIRTALVPVCNVGSQLLWPLVMIGICLNFAAVDSLIGNIFVWAGIAFFGLSFLFSLATLPVEFNASKRAVQLLRGTGTLDEEEIVGTKKVLGAAALTYDAALVMALLNLLRFLLFVLMQRRND